MVKGLGYADTNIHTLAFQHKFKYFKLLSRNQSGTSVIVLALRTECTKSLESLEKETTERAQGW